MYIVKPMPCPWYFHGVCTSPKLPEPTEDVVAIERCTSDAAYKGCSLFMESSNPAIKKASPKKERLKIYAPIHAVPPNTSIECPYGEIMNIENGYSVVLCKILERPLTKYELPMCDRYWRECPYRVIAPI